MQKGNLTALLPGSDATMQNNVTIDEQHLDLLRGSFRFKPSDEELLCYLERKLAGLSAPSDLIPQVDIYKFTPHQLKARYNKRSGNDSMFFFSPRNRRYPNGSRPDRRVGNIGYWKASRTVPLKRKNRVVGSKMILNFHSRTPKNSINTHWIMEEFVIKEASGITQNPATSSANPLDKKFDDLCLYKIHYHKTKADKQECQDAQEMEIPCQDLQNSAQESRSQQNQLSMNMSNDVFIPATSTSAASTAMATPAHSTLYLCNCDPVPHYINNGYCLAADLLPEPSIGDRTFSMPSVPVDTFIPLTTTATSTATLASPMMNMSNDTFIPATSTSTSTSAASTAAATPPHCDPVSHYINNGYCLAADKLPEPSIGDFTFSMPSAPIDTCIPATATTTSISTLASPTYCTSNREPITPIFNNVDYSGNLVPNPSMRDYTFSIPSMPNDALIPATSTSTPTHPTYYTNNSEPITPIFNNLDYSGTLVLEPSNGDCPFSIPSMPDDALIPATATSTSTQASSTYCSSNSEPITPIFNSVDDWETPLPEPTKEDWDILYDFMFNQ